MAAKVKPVLRKKGSRQTTGHDPLMTIRFSSELRQSVDDWADGARTPTPSPLALPRLRAPMTLKIGPQHVTEMAVRLLFRVEGQVAPEEVEWLLSNAELTAVTDGTDNSRAGEILDGLHKSGVHSIGRSDLVADEPAFETAAIDPAAAHDGLVCEAVAEEARQSQVGHARNDPFLAGGQCQIGAGFSQYVIHHQQMLATSADSEGVDRSDPRLFHGGPRQIVGRGIPSGNAAKDFVLVAHHMLKVEQERDFALIEVGEIDASGK